MRIGIDLDGVMRDFVGKFIEIIKRDYPDTFIGHNMSKWNFCGISNIPYKDREKIWKYSHSEELYSQSKPLDNSIEKFKEIRKWAKENNHKLICVTSQKEHNFKYTLQWIAKHNLVFDEIHFTKDKYNVNIDFLIDDDSNQFKNWIKNGREINKFIMYNQDYNQKSEAAIRINNILEIIKIINNYEKNLR